METGPPPPQMVSLSNNVRPEGCGIKYYNEPTNHRIQFALVIEYHIICLYQYVKLIAKRVVTCVLPVEAFANGIKNLISENCP